MTFLQAVLQHWSVNFRENVTSYFDYEVRPNTHDSGVKGGVVNFAHGHSVRYNWGAVHVGIRNDVRCIQQLFVL